MILQETQMDRDRELAAISGENLEAIQSMELCAPGAIRIFDENREPPGTQAAMENIYKEYKWLDITAYLRTLMFTSVERRHPELLDLLKKTKGNRCLDFGSGVGTHAIALCENDNEVTLMDIPGQLSDFAQKRLQRRGLECTFIDAGRELPEEYFDVAICSDVLEHTFDPVAEFLRIANSLKQGGTLHLLVSEMVKPSSGHFASSIALWQETGQPLLAEYFTPIGQTLFIKNGRLS